MSENMGKGFMRISRDKFNSWCWRGNMNKNYLMMFLLVNANFKSERFEKIIVEKGQYVFSYDGLSRDSGMPLQTLRTTLKDLVETKQITIKSTRKWSLLTICEYDSWQISDNETNTQVVTQMDNNIIIEELNKQIEELKKELTNVSKKKERSNVFVKPTVEEIAAYVLEKAYHFDAESFYAYYESKGWMVGKSKMKDWKSACVTWEKRRKDENPSLFESQQNKKDPWIPNLEKYEPAELEYIERFDAYEIPNKCPECDADWPYNPSNRLDGAKVCNGSTVWRWDASHKVWINLSWEEIQKIINRK